MKVLGALLVSLLGISASAEIHSGTDGLRSSDAEHWRLFTGTLEGAREMVVYVGTPPRDAEGPRPTGKVIEIHDFEFVDQPLRIPAETAARLTALVSDRRSFRPYGGFKFCGGFHPDLCIEWRFENNGQRWRSLAFICLSCGEWRLVNSTSALHADMSDQSHRELRAIATTLRARITK